MGPFGFKLSSEVTRRSTYYNARRLVESIPGSLEPRYVRPPAYFPNQAMAIPLPRLPQG